MDRRVPAWSQSKDVTVPDTIKQTDALPRQAIMKFQNNHLPRLEHLGPSLVIVEKKIGVMRFWPAGIDYINVLSSTLSEI